jgi:hypothetical protein
VQPNINHCGEKMPSGTIWETTILKDFDALSKAGLEHSLMTDIKQFLDHH